MLRALRPGPAGSSLAAVVRPGASAVGVFQGLLLLAGCASAPLRSTPPRPPPPGAEVVVASDGTRLFAAVDGDGRTGVVWLVLGPEAGSAPPYPRLTAALLGAGYAVAVLHPRGSGYSEGPRGDTDDAARGLEDLREHARRLAGRFSGRPLFLLGHSAGAAYALEVAASGAAPVAGLVLVNPAYRLLTPEGMGPTCGEVLGYAWSFLFRPAALTVDMNSRPEAVADPDDRAEALAMREDPLVVRYFSLRFMTAERAVMERCAENARRVTAPLLLVEGTRDVLVDPRGSEALFQASAGADKERLRSPGAHGSSAVEAVAEELVGWFRRHR